MKQPIPILVFIYNSYRDPLFQNLLLRYIKTLSENGCYRFDLITFEQPEYALTAEETQQEKKELEDYNIYWHPRKFHTGRFLLIKKAIDVITTFFLVFSIKLKYKTQYIFAFANVAAAISVIFTRLLNLKLVIYSYEPHSDFMVELGLWQKSSWNYLILNSLEKMAARHASDIMTGTIHMVEKLKAEGIKAKVYRAPTAVDSGTFYFKPEARYELRKSLDVHDKTVYIYPGKLGGLYYEREIINLFAALYAHDDHAFFLIATNYDHDKIVTWMKEENIPQSAYHLRPFIPSSQMPDYLSAADMGIVAIPPTPSQKFRSPTKVAEYLLCGLPYIVCKGISEDDTIAKEHKVGIVLNQYSKNNAVSDMTRISALLLVDKSVMQQRCINIGLTYRSYQNIINVLYNIFV
ncbi:hypothetical protein N6H18_03120 [Reichenbachiella agarivorans]|uniref:Uncharacterized protein n=1 Tax=Reichenbachiella agarivorans TaxID=2979464 RepID=A0ABY6CR29_9BACT|nr:hypothetical protein [Reichenbachiella agarivorans]UXP32946.1 hypothetical protein N6H18_03120 [Reichenbachiella agarivorans]